MMASESAQPLQGMSDIASPEIYLWQFLEQRARTSFHQYGYTEVRTPLLERKNVFVRSLGDGTDVVQKEMYAFEDRGGREIALRPEGTAGTIRHLLGKGMEGRNDRVFYMGPMFRCERPQAGRKRQFHQIGVEAASEPNAILDAECIEMQMRLMECWGLSGCELQLNTRGVGEDKQHVVDGLKLALSNTIASMCDDCRSRYDQNTLRILDCKKESCRAIIADLPPVTDFMAEETRAYLQEVTSVLDLYGVVYKLNPLLVRGLDYYEHTVWEITHPSLGAQDALAGGGRYRIQYGKDAFEGVGFAMGVERVCMALTSIGITGEQHKPSMQIALISLGERALKENAVLCRTLRREGFSCIMETTHRSMKAQMRSANRHDVKLALIRGDDELNRGTCLIKQMNEGSQQEVSLDVLIQQLRELTGTDS